MIIILGAGLSGLAAGLQLTKAGHETAIIEKELCVGGLAKTIRYGDFSFDLGGHRFLTNNPRLQSFVQELLGDDLLCVPRRSQIYLNGRYVDYPLSPANAVFGMGLPVTFNILSDYISEKVRALFSTPKLVSLEDWVVFHFGRSMFNLYFKEYSEKVWGLDCRSISMEWVSKRIDGLSLAKAVKHALFKTGGNNLKTLTDTFYYPRQGIGQLAERMSVEISRNNSVRTGTTVEKIFHDGDRIKGVMLSDGTCEYVLQGSQYLSSIPLSKLLQSMTPAPPREVRDAASKISFRSLAIVTLMLNKERVTDLTWMYLPGKEIPFGRIHEPKNWSGSLAPSGKTHVVAEYFCKQDDDLWNQTDNSLSAITSEHLQNLGFIQRHNIVDRCVLRIPFAYPVFDLEYKKHVKSITDYLAHFSNLHLTGRSGTFSYLNMDQAMESGMGAAEKIIKENISEMAGESKTAASCALL